MAYKPCSMCNVCFIYHLSEVGEATGHDKDDKLTSKSAMRFRESMPVDQKPAPFIADSACSV